MDQQEQSEPLSVAIIGGGLAGLVAAYEIHTKHPGAVIDLFEASDRLGGKLFTVPFRSSGEPGEDVPESDDVSVCCVDVGAEAFLYRRKDMMDFIDELGLSEEILFPSGYRSLIYQGGKAHPIPTIGVMGIPSSSEGLGDLVSEETKRRIDAEGSAPGIAWTPGVSEVSVGALVRERYGDDLVDHVVSALLGGVYSSQADDLGLRATVPQLAAVFDEMAVAGEPVTLSGAVGKIEAARKKGAASQGAQPAKPQPVFGTFRGGFATLYTTLAERSGARIHLDSFVSAVERERDTARWVVSGVGVSGVYDRLVMATPAPTTALLLKQVAPRAAAAASQVDLASSVVVALRFSSDEGLPNNSGVLIAADEPGLHAKAFTLSSKKWPHLEGTVVRASFGRYGQELLTDEDQLVDYALDDLQTVTGFDGRAAIPEEIFVQYWYGGLPRYGDTHLAIVAEFEAALTDEVNGAGGVGVDTSCAVVGAWLGGVGVPAVVAYTKRQLERW